MITQGATVRRNPAAYRHLSADYLAEHGVVRKVYARLGMTLALVRWRMIETEILVANLQLVATERGR